MLHLSPQSPAAECTSFLVQMVANAHQLSSTKSTSTQYRPPPQGTGSSARATVLSIHSMRCIHSYGQQMGPPSRYCQRRMRSYSRLNSKNSLHEQCRLFLLAFLYPLHRNAMWRFGYVNPINYNDNEVFCGGVDR